MTAGCDTSGITVLDPDISPDPDRALTISVQLEDTALARRLGWENGVPNAAVIIQRTGDAFHPDSALTNSSGHARFEMVFPGQYRIAAYRKLAEEETVATGGVVRAFADGLKAAVTPPAAVYLHLRIDERGSVVFSELYPAMGLFGETVYQWYQYFELYNNSDTTIYLDGMLWGWAWDMIRDYTPVPCTATAAWRDDPRGIWAHYFHQFPGSGRTYPLPPGETVTVALDAVDHSVVSPTFPDLSHADFELQGTADANNPDVPDLIEVGPVRWFRAHGLDVVVLFPLFLALPLDPEDLIRQRDPFHASEWALIPHAAVLDVVRGDLMNFHDDNLYPPCDAAVSRLHERMEAAIPTLPRDTTLSMHRKILRVTSDGQIVLQDVNTSFVDFVEGKYSAGVIPY